MTTPQLHHCLRYADADAALAFLTAIGFTERLVVRDETDPTKIAHAELRWRETGGVMFGSVRDDDKRFPPGTGVCNLVVDTDDEVDAMVQRAQAAGATLVDGPANPPYGGRSAGVRDAEGNYWNFDSYQGA